MAVADAVTAALVVELESSLRGLLDMGGVGKQKGHAAGCPAGQWTGKYHPPAYPDGAPCSPRCAGAQAALEHARGWLELNARKAARAAESQGKLI